jgi:pyruvate ferredoxin oxidoreductase gamma subunit
VCTVAASEIALARIGRPLPNAALLGAFAAITRQLAFESVSAAIRQKFRGKVADANVSAAEAAYAAVMDQLETTHAQAD